MRIAIGQLWQESNTLNPVPTTREDFEQFGLSRGSRMVEEMAQTNELGGFIQSLRRWPERPEIVGLARLPAWPGGALTEDTFEWLTAQMEEAVQSALPVNAVLLALHGAMTAEKHPDVEGEILGIVRRLIGLDIPLVVTLDMHANITREMAQAADALVLYHTIPHVDIFETGQRGATLLRRILIQKVRPVTAWQPVPVVLSADRGSTEEQEGLAVDRKRALQQLEARAGVLTAGVAIVQPWLDIPHLSSAVTVTTDNDPELASEICRELAVQLWDTRRAHLPDLVCVEEAVRRAHELDTGLTVLSDAADATTSGAPGDSVWLLMELLKYQWSRPVLVPLVAPHIVRQARQVGRDRSISVRLGGVRDRRFGTSVDVDANVENLFDARFVMSGHLGKNLPIDMGPSVVLRTGNVGIVVTSRTGPHFAPELFQTAGYDPFRAAVVVAKSPVGFRAAYAKHARQIFSVQAPGCAPLDIWNYEFKNISRPLWPWDEVDDWQPEPVLFEH